MSKYRIHSGPVSLVTDRQVATVVMEISQLVLSQFKKTFNIVHWELNKAYPYQKQEVKVIWQKAPHGGPFPS